MRAILAVTLLMIAGHTLAMSKLYDVDAGLVMKDGLPCIYSVVPLKVKVPSFLQGQGVQFSVYDEATSQPMWDMWLKARPLPLPQAPETCVRYGVVSPDQNRTPAKPLVLNTVYTFDMAGETGRQEVQFCIRKDGQSKDYLAQVARRNECTSAPFSEPLR